MSDFASEIEISGGKGSLTDKEIMRLRKRSKKDIEETRKNDCRHCIYLAGTKDIRSGTYCNYLGITGHIRPCFAGECRGKGVFRAI